MLNNLDYEEDNNSDTDKSKALKAFCGTKLLEKNTNSLTKPAIKKQNQMALVKAIADMATQQARASMDVAAALREIIKAFCQSEPSTLRQSTRTELTASVASVEEH